MAKPRRNANWSVKWKRQLHTRSARPRRNVKTEKQRKSSFFFFFFSFFFFAESANTHPRQQRFDVSRQKELDDAVRRTNVVNVVKRSTDDGTVDVVVRVKKKGSKTSSLKRRVNRERKTGDVHPSLIGFSGNIPEPFKNDVETTSPVFFAGRSPQMERRTATYVNQVKSPTAEQAAALVLRALNNFQRNGASKAASKPKRFVSGLRQVTNAVRLRKVKLLIVAHDPFDPTESLLGAVDRILEFASSSLGDDSPRIPVLMSCSEKTLNTALGLRRNGRATVVGVLDADGVHDLVSRLVRLSDALGRMPRTVETCGKCGREAIKPVRCGLCRIGPLCPTCSHAMRGKPCVALEDDQVAQTIVWLRRALEAKGGREWNAVKGRTHEMLTCV